MLYCTNQLVIYSPEIFYEYNVKYFISVTANYSILALCGFPLKYFLLSFLFSSRGWSVVIVSLSLYLTASTFSPLWGFSFLFKTHFQLKKQVNKYFQWHCHMENPTFKSKNWISRVRVYVRIIYVCTLVSQYSRIVMHVQHYIYFFSCLVSLYFNYLR